MVYSETMAVKVNVYQFDDYRDLLVALINERKQDKRIFSYRWFSQKANLSSPNFLNLVVKRKRHLSTETVDKVIEIFQLSTEQAIFFRHLTAFNKAKTLSEKEHFAGQLTKLKKFQNEYPLSQDQFEYYSKWYHIPIRELLHLKNPPKNEEEISDILIPYLHRTLVAEALEKLRSLKLISKTNQPQAESVTTGHKFTSYGVVQFHKQMMSLGAEALDRFAASEREVSSVTVGLSQQSFLKIQKMIEELRSQIMSIAEEEQNKDRVYQLNFQVFPLSRRRQKKTKVAK